MSVNPDGRITTEFRRVPEGPQDVTLTSEAGGVSLSGSRSDLGVLGQAHRVEVNHDRCVITGLQVGYRFTLHSKLDPLSCARTQRFRCGAQEQLRAGYDGAVTGFSGTLKEPWRPKVWASLAQRLRGEPGIALCEQTQGEICCRLVLRSSTWW